MSAAEPVNNGVEKDVGIAPASTANGSNLQPQMTHEERETAKAAARFGYGPLAQVNTNEARLPPFGGEFQPGLYKPVEGRKFGNPAPLGLCAFALTTFVLSAINMNAENITTPSIVIGAAFAYGGLVQLLAGMWYVSPPQTPKTDFRNLESNADVTSRIGKWPSVTPLVLLLCLRTVDSGSVSPSS